MKIKNGYIFDYCDSIDSLYGNSDYKIIEKSINSLPSESQIVAYWDFSSSDKYERLYLTPRGVFHEIGDIDEDTYDDINQQYFKIIKLERI